MITALATDGYRIVGPGGRESAAYPAIVPHVAVAEWEGDLVIWTTAELPDYPADIVTERGWRRLTGLGRRVLVGPTRGSSFAGLGVEETALAVDTYLEALGVPYIYSETRSLEALLPRLGPAGAEPTLHGPHESAWPATGICYVRDSAIPPGSFLRCYDRVGSFLSAWGGQDYPDGVWIEDGPMTFSTGAQVPPGYWNIDTRRLSRDWLYARIGQEAPGPCWVTTPLLQLAIELEGQLDITMGYRASGRKRHLDGPAQTIGRALLALDPADPIESRVRDAIKRNGYAKLTNLFGADDKLPPGWRRPYWRRAIWDRFVANTYRSLARASGLVAWCRVDTAIFAVAEAQAQPAGLNATAGRLGAWKPVGRAVGAEEGAAVLAAKGPGAVVDLARAA